MLLASHFPTPTPGVNSQPLKEVPLSGPRGFFTSFLSVGTPVKIRPPRAPCAWEWASDTVLATEM